MSVSVNPVVGWNFRTSLASTYGEALTLTAAGGASRSASGLDVDGQYKNASATTPAALKMTLPITLMIVGTRSATYSTESWLAGLSHSNAFGSPFAAIAILGSSGNAIQFRGNSAGTYVAPSDGSAHGTGAQTVFVEFSSSGVKVWQNSATSLALNVATSYSNPTYSGTSFVWVGNPLWSGFDHNAKLLVTDYVYWNATLTEADRTALLADPLAYEGAASTPFRPYFITG